MPTIGEARAAKLGSDDGVKRIDLPDSGGWLHLNTRPSWGKLMAIRRAMGQNGKTEEDSINLILVTLTTEWSFDDNISEESFEQLDLEDIAVLLEEVNLSVLPLFEKMTRSNTQRNSL